jgi:Tfp pilus assembly protein PilW
MSKTAFPTSFIRRDDCNARRAFTLVEIMVGAALSSAILAGVLSVFLMIGRVSANLRNYSDIEMVARKGLEIMSREMHMAYNVSSYSGSSVTLSIPDSSPDAPPVVQQAALGAYSVTYAYDSVNKLITRNGPPIHDPTGSATTTTLVSDAEQIPGAGNNVFNYYRYVTGTAAQPGQGYANQYNGNTITIYTSPSAIQQIEVKFFIKRRNTTVTSATNKVLSARFILRNKR